MVGTVVICVQNLDCSGANQVILNIVQGNSYKGNILLISPKVGDFGNRFFEFGVAVRIGDLKDILIHVRDISCIICNTIMTAKSVLLANEHNVPVLWILHEWWDAESLQEQLQMRSLQERLTFNDVREALDSRAHVVCVCTAQRHLFMPKAVCSVLYVGVPDPAENGSEDITLNSLTSSTCSSFYLRSDSSASSRRPSDPTFFNGTYDACLSTELDCDVNGKFSAHPALDDYDTRYSEFSFATAVKSGKQGQPFTFLCIGIVCPRKNQLWTIEIFQKFADELGLTVKDVRLEIVGARRTRPYEIDYLNSVLSAARKDHRIVIYDVSHDVASHYQRADCVILTSLNEVTPMVICEAMSFGLPVISTGIAGIPEMMDNGVEGYLINSSDKEHESFYNHLSAVHSRFNVLQLFQAADCLHSIYSDGELRRRMASASRQRFEKQFSLSSMNARYETLIHSLVPKTILVDLDGVVADWDAHFAACWSNYALSLDLIDRKQSYFMEQCVPSDHSEIAESIFLSKKFFLDIPPMTGALEAVKSMKDDFDLRVIICTTPIWRSQFCLQEKVDWIQKMLGEKYLEDLVICSDKSSVLGDVLIDDKPLDSLSPQTIHRARWQHVIFDAPYNKSSLAAHRLYQWADWTKVILPLIGKLDIKDKENL